jgi:hypothetical protein
VAERFLRAAAAAGTPRLAGELVAIVALATSHGEAALVLRWSGPRPSAGSPLLTCGQSLTPVSAPQR